MINYRFAEITNERDAVNSLISLLEESIKQNIKHPIESFSIALEQEQNEIKALIKEFEDKCEKFNYNPNNHEINKHIGRAITIKAIEKAKLMLPDIFIHFHNKQFANDYQKLNKISNTY